MFWLGLCIDKRYISWYRLIKEVALTQPPLLFNQEVRLLRTNSPMQSTMVWTIAGWPWRTQSTAKAPATAYKETTFPHVTPDRRHTSCETIRTKSTTSSLSSYLMYEHFAKLQTNYYLMIGGFLENGDSKWSGSFWGVGVVYSATNFCQQLSSEMDEQIMQPQQQPGIRPTCLCPTEKETQTHRLWLGAAGRQYASLD